MEKMRNTAELFKQVSDPTRLQVIALLREDSRHVGAICDALGNQSQPAVSHHLSLLRHSGMIYSTRNGKQNVYSLTEKGESLADVVAAFVE